MTNTDDSRMGRGMYTSMTPKGSRNVAAGGAQRNPWNKSDLPTAAPVGAEELAWCLHWICGVVVSAAPSGRNGMRANADHGFRCAPPVATRLSPSGARMFTPLRGQDVYTAGPGRTSGARMFTPLRGQDVYTAVPDAPSPAEDHGPACWPVHGPTSWPMPPQMADG